MAECNPFLLSDIPPGAPFCDREDELRDLLYHARNKASVVLSSPRRFGKTSLVKRVQAQLAREGVLTVYADLFGVGSVDRIATRIAEAIYATAHRHEGWMKTVTRALKTFRPVFRPDASDGMAMTVERVAPAVYGVDLLGQAMEDLTRLAREVDGKVHVVLDEFQELTELTESAEVEGVLRRHVQEQKVPYIFVGSRRRILLEMFNSRNRPFFRSSFNVALPPLPHEDLTSFLVGRFASGGIECSPEVAGQIAFKIGHHPYYAQKLAYLLFGRCDRGKTLTADMIAPAYEQVLRDEIPFFEMSIHVLASKQILVLQEIARSPVKEYAGREFLGRTGVSLGAMQKAMRVLSREDLIEKTATGQWQVVDPVMAGWLARG